MWISRFIVFFLLSTVTAHADAYTSDAYDLKLVTVASGLSYPWGLAFLPGGQMIVTERDGNLRIVSQDGTLSSPLSGVPDVYAGGQGGLLDVAPDPDFAVNRTLYLSYAEKGPDGVGTAVASARLNDAQNRIENVTVIFRQLPKTSGGRHFGSRLVFGRDGNLFITTGDRGERHRVQDFSINRGQVIRIKPDGSVPPDNPFVGKQGYRPEVWSHGHRNPQGMAVHPVTGEIWTVEHGARGGDEINIPRAGRNYGWPVISYGRHYSGGSIGEGTHKAGMEQPQHYWDPSIAPSGMTFYTGDVFAKWKGSLFVGALKFRLLARLTLNGNKIVSEERLLEGLDERIRDVRQGPDGYLYILTDSDEGRIIRIEPAG